MPSIARISVVVPLYNKGPYIERTLTSALNAVPKVHEIIVVDDGSSDDGPERVMQLAARFNDSRLTLIRQPNCGVSAARNHGIRQATGEFIAFLDADDIWMPNYIPQIQLLIRRFPDCDLFATHYFPFTREEELSTPQLYEKRGHEGETLLKNFFDMWSRENIFYTCSAVIRRSAFFENNIFFPENESLGEDQDVWFRFAEKRPIAYSSRPLVAYRVGLTGSLSKKPLTGLPPFVQRLNERYNAGRIPAEHRRGVARILGSHRLTLAMTHLRSAYQEDWARGVSLLFDRFSVRAPKFWLKVLFLACLPLPIRLRLIQKGKLLQRKPETKSALIKLRNT